MPRPPPRPLFFPLYSGPHERRSRVPFLPGRPRSRRRPARGAPRPRGAPARPRQQPVVAPGSGLVRAVRRGLRRRVRRGAGPPPRLRPRRGADPADPGPPGRAGRPRRAGRHHRLPRLRLPRPPRPREAARPHPALRRRQLRAGTARRPRAARRVELARHDDVGRGLRERLALARPLPRARLRGPTRPGEGRLRAPDQARRHPPRDRVGDPQPAALRHPHRERELRRGLRGELPRGRPLAGRRGGDARGAPRRGRGREPRRQARAPGHPARLGSRRS